jgi:hypothetical protein
MLPVDRLGTDDACALVTSIPSHDNLEYIDNVV